MKDPKIENMTSSLPATFLVCFSILVSNPQSACSQDKHPETGSHTFAIAVKG
ncbi:MAG: hypothetical protein JW943_11535 [Deltaproteobacteria bacterium]|nr:hypothetical protein [Deltaproteobacteria bacterium]